MNKKNIITWVIFFLIFFAVSQYFGKQQAAPPPELTGTKIAVVPSKNEFVTGEEVIVRVRNNTDAAVTLPSNCPQNPFNVLAWTGQKFEGRSAQTKIRCELDRDIVIPAHQEKAVSYTYWTHALFANPGRYKVALSTVNGTTTLSVESPEFTVVEAGFLRKAFRTVFYQPIYNVLIFLIKIAPAGDLGFAVILLTLIVRLILLIPSQRGIVSQRRMQELQPKLEQVRKKHAGNQERIAQETMQLWKEHKVNPFSSCFPLIIQFPVLIALYYVIRNGLNPDNTYMIYGSLQSVDLSNIHTNFLGILELTKNNAFALPLIVGVLQFLQLKLAMLKRKKVTEGEKDEKQKGSEMDTANKTMTYIMPVMIAVFTASVPAGVGLYWGISTLFALAQQMVANRKLKPI